MTRICVVMAVYRPKPEFLHEQFASIAAQTHTQHDLVCVAADRSSQSLIHAVARDTGLELKVFEPDTRLDAVRAFEFGLEKARDVFPDTEVFALADQDDVWTSERLTTGLRALLASEVDLVHSDASLIDLHGREIARSLFAYDQRAKQDDARTLLYGNTVTGMTTLFRRRLLDRALPFPTQDGIHFYHDLWLALVASTGNGIVRLEQPLVAYRQHSQNVVGAGEAAPPTTLRQAAAGFALARYLAVSARERGGNTEALEPFWKPTQVFHFLADTARLLMSGSIAAARQAATFAAVSGARPLWALAQTALRLGPSELRAELLRLDHKLYAMSPGHPPNQPSTLEPKPSSTAEPWWIHFDPRTRIKWTPEFSAREPAYNVLVPSLNPAEIFAGIATAIDLGLALAARGHAVRFIATDLPMAAPSASRAFVLGRASKDGIHHNISLACGVSAETLPSHPDDQFVATAWWTAHVAQALTEHPQSRAQDFHYLIQDYEPLFYPWGTEHAGALASYDLAARPIFNTQLLADYTFAQGHRFVAAPLVFAPSINVAEYACLNRKHQSRPRLVLYGRPEVTRNLFPLAIESLGHFVEEQGLRAGDVDVVSLGLKHRNVLLPGGVEIRSLGKLPWSDYPTFLAQSDVGLSLMMSPHPSHPPIEMAAAGMRVVTNSFGPKDLGTLAPHILSTEMTVPALSSALKRAWDMPAPNQTARRFSIDDLGGSLDRVADAMHRTSSFDRARCAA